MERKKYPSDLTDHEWELIEPLIPAAKSGGRPRGTDMREAINAMFYVLRTGCAWEYLPHDFPNYKTVFDYFNEWSRNKVLERFNDVLVKKVRTKLERNEEPSVCIIDSQTAKSAEKKGHEVTTQARKPKGLKGILGWT
jgi:putative transposase